MEIYTICGKIAQHFRPLQRFASYAYEFMHFMPFIHMTLQPKFEENQLSSSRDICS